MDLMTYLKAVLGLALVLGLILGLAWLMKRLGLAGGVKNALGRRRRLGTVEAVMLDGRHRAVLLRRDDVEHLVLIGPNTSQVIERNIPAAPASADDTPAPPATPFGAMLSRITTP